MFSRVTNSSKRDYLKTAGEIEISNQRADFLSISDDFSVCQAKPLSFGGGHMYNFIGIVEGIFFRKAIKCRKYGE